MENRNVANKRSSLETAADWPSDPELGGPYGYHSLIIQRGGFRLGCDAPFIRVDDPKEIYRALADAQRELIAHQPRSLPEAFKVHDSDRGGSDRSGGPKAVVNTARSRPSMLGRILRRRNGT